MNWINLRLYVLCLSHDSICIQGSAWIPTYSETKQIKQNSAGEVNDVNKYLLCKLSKHVSEEYDNGLLDWNIIKNAFYSVHDRNLFSNT